MKTIGVIGTRRRNSDKDKQVVVSKFLEVYELGDRICSGLCPEGADSFAVMIQDHIIREPEPLWFPANWKKYGKSAGFIRNTDIALNSNVLIACVSEDRTGGTEDTIKKFIKFHGAQNLILV